MEAFTVLTAVAAPLDLANVDTDQIIPARFLKKPRATGYDNYLFHDLRFDPDGTPHPDFVLNRPAFKGARILVAGPNFGGGSSREGAVYALVDAGIRAVVAPSFGDIFHSNALKNGLVPVAVPADLAADLRAALTAEPGLELTVDLERQVLRGANREVGFTIDPFRRECLLKGIDEIDLTLQYHDRIAAFRDAHWAVRPWLAP